MTFLFICVSNISGIETVFYYLILLGVDKSAVIVCAVGAGLGRKTVVLLYLTITDGKNTFE